MEAVALVDGFISAGSSLHIRFSHSTNMPSVLDQSDLYKIISLSPPSLHEASTVAGWKDNRTLVVVFPSFQNGITSMENISEHNITVSFSQSSGIELINHSNMKFCGRSTFSLSQIHVVVEGLVFMPFVMLKVILAMSRALTGLVIQMSRM